MILAETFQVREYAPGDSPRQIHWKLSSKLDRMIVRVAGLPLERSVLLLWERRGTPAAQESDAMAEVMAVVCQELLRQGVGCRAAWNGGGELTVQEVREPEGFLRAAAAAFERSARRGRRDGGGAVPAAVRRGAGREGDLCGDGGRSGFGGLLPAGASGEPAVQTGRTGAGTSVYLWQRGLCVPAAELELY